jgi:hypothetical protein
MCIYKSYFEKNNTIISDSRINTAKNQVSEIVYGGIPNIHSRYIFKINLDNLISKIETQEIDDDKIISHRLILYNTINDLNKYIGADFNKEVVKRKRASSFQLILFDIDEDWHEGSGYDITFNPLSLKNPKNTSPSNWFDKKTNEDWYFNGIYSGDTYNIIDVIDFDNGDENIDVDITEYINNIIYNGYENNGLGLAFRYDIEQTLDDTLYSVAFHTKYTNTIYEPHLVTTFNTTILDDRNNFKLDHLNKLYFYAKNGQNFLDITPIKVNIYNNKYQLIEVFDQNDIVKQTKGIYYIEFELRSDENVDSVLYSDEWEFELNNEIKKIENEFYLIENGYNFYIQNVLSKNILNLTLRGILNKQKIKRGQELIIDIIIKKLYNQDNSMPFDFEYRIYIPQSGKTELEIIPFTKINRAPNKYFILMDTTIFIPSTYRIQVKLNNVDYTLNFEEIEFTIID